MSRPSIAADDELRSAAAQESWWTAVVLLPEYPRKPQHLRLVFPQRSSVLLRQRARLQLRSMQHQVTAVRIERDGTQVGARGPESVLRQAELAADARIEQ